MFRPMLRKKQQLPEAECIQLLTEEKRGVLSLIGDDGYPYGLPMDHWYDPQDGCLYFHCGKLGHKLDAIRSCPKASYCVYDSGTRLEGNWYLTFRSVIVFGTVEILEDFETAMEAVRKLSLKFTEDTSYIEEEIRQSAKNTLVFRLVPQHISGKIVNEL